MFLAIVSNTSALESLIYLQIKKAIHIIEVLKLFITFFR